MWCVRLNYGSPGPKAQERQSAHPGGQLTLVVNSRDILFKVFAVLLLVPCNKEVGEERFRMCKLCVLSSRNWRALVTDSRAVLCRGSSWGQRGHSDRRLDQRILAVNSLKGAKAEGKDSAGNSVSGFVSSSWVTWKGVLHSEHAPSVSLHCPLLCPFLSHHFPLCPIHSFISASMFAYNKWPC